MCIETDAPAAISADYGAAPCRMAKYCSPLNFERRQQLILDSLPEVRRIACRIHARLPSHVLLDDLIHSGILGLIDAVEKFDPAKNVPLQAYAQTRIRGAILDNLRELDWSPRSLRRQARRIEQAHSELVAILGCVPSEPEVAAHLGLRLDKYQHILTQLHRLTAGARQGPLEFTSQEEEHVAWSNSTNEDPLQLCVRAEVARILIEAIDTLSRRERQALALYYFKEKTMKEIGSVLNIHESRVSQIIAAALDHLRERLEEAKGVA